MIHKRIFLTGDDGYHSISLGKNNVANEVLSKSLKEKEFELWLYISMCSTFRTTSPIMKVSAATPKLNPAISRKRLQNGTSCAMLI